jgi:hypothetical protein
MCLESERIVAKPRNYVMELKCVGVVLVVIHLKLWQLVRKILTII